VLLRDLVGGRTVTYNLYGGTPPHVRGSDTSTAAAKSQLPKISALHKRIEAYIRSQGAFGATEDEVSAWGNYLHQTATARIRELVLHGRVQDSGGRRKTRTGRWARVYVVSGEAFGEEQLGLL
jgi:hypothetical protein